MAGRAVLFRPPGGVEYAVLVNGSPGVVVRRGGDTVSVMGFTIAEGRITGIQILLDPERLAALDLPRPGA